MLGEVIEILIFSVILVIIFSILSFLLLKVLKDRFRFTDVVLRSLRNLLLSGIFLGSGGLFMWLMQGILYSALISFCISSMIFLISIFFAHKFLPLSSKDFEG